MKTKTIKLFGIIMMLVMGMSFNACSSDDDDGGGASGKKGNLVGNWYGTFDGGEGQLLYTFYSGGDYKCQEYDLNSSYGEVETEYGTWKYVDGDLILTEDGDDDKNYYTVKWLGNNEIKITDEYGYSEEFERVDFSKLPKEDNSISGSKGNLVGNWYYSDSEGCEMLWVLSSNGKFKEIERDDDDGNKEEYEYYGTRYGTWSYDDGELIICYDDGYVDSGTVKWIGSNKIELIYDDGYKSVWSRVSYSTLPKN